MALVLKDRVKGWTDSYGEDNFVIFATTNGYQSFSVIGNGNQTYYTVFDPTTYDWEVGIGTYTAATTTLSRDTILSSSNNNLIVSFQPGTKELFVGYPAEKAVTLDTPQTLTNKTLVSATVTSGTINNTTIGATTPASGAFTTLVASGASLTSVNAGVALLTSATITTLNATGASIASANIGNLQFTAASIASINAGVAVITNLSATSASIASMNASVALLTTATVTNLTATGASIASANIGNLQFTAASIASINAGVAVITNLTATGASIASANVGTAVITAATVTGASIASANVGTAVITTGTVTNLTSTSASVASINAAVALITTGTVTALTATGASVASANVGTAVVTGLTVTNASIASLNAGTATITTGNLTFSSTAQRITGDFSNGTFSNRLSFQSTTTNGVTGVQALPNGTNQTATFDVYNAADPTNASFGQLQINSGDVRVVSNIRGTGTYLPLTFYTGGSERMRLSTTGELGLGVAAPTIPLQIGKGGGGNPATSGTTQTYGIARIGSGGAAALDVGTYAAGQVWMQGVNVTNLATNYDLILQPNGGNVGIGTASPAYPLTLGNNKRFGALNTAAAGVNFAIIDGSNNLTFGDDSANTNTATFQSRGGTIFNVNLSERARFNTTGAFVFAGGTTTADGIGITFPATQSASSDANTLDDYEEGTWTPTLKNASSSSTFTSNTGRYTKIGRLVYCSFVTDSGNTGTAGSDITLSGLPFAFGGTSNVPTLVAFTANGIPAAVNYYSSRTANGSTSFVVRDAGGNALTNQLSFAAGTIIYEV